MDWARMTVSDGIDLAYAERGAGPPVVLVPGWSYGSLACYAAIEQRGHEVARSLTVLDERIGA